MCVQNLFKPNVPTLPPVEVPKTPAAPDAENSGAAVADARRKTRAAAALARGSGNNLTGPGGLDTPASTAKKVLLGG